MVAVAVKVTGFKEEKCPRCGGTRRGAAPGSRHRSRPGSAHEGADDRNTRQSIANSSSLVASQAWVIHPCWRSSGADGPPIFVATHPGSKALDRTSFQCLATANANRTS